MTVGDGVADASAVLRGLPAGWTVVHDGSTAGSADADHVVVGPGGIFLVSVRDRPGPAYALSREDDTIACSTAADVVADMSGPYARRVRPVLCIVGDAELLEQALDVLVCSTATLATALTSAPVVLADAQAEDAVALLGGAPAVEETVPVVPPRGKRARAVEPDSEPDAGPDAAPATAVLPVEAPRGKRARVVEPEVPPIPPISVPLIQDPPKPRPEPAPKAAPVAAPVVEAVAEPEPAAPTEPSEPEVKLTGRAKRVAEAMATRDAHAAKLAEQQGTNGAAQAKSRGKGRIGKVVKLLVAAAVVGVLALNGPHLYSTAGSWGPDLWAQLNGKSGAASACAPVSATTSAAPTPKADGKRATARKATAKASRSKADRKADARKQRQRQKAAATPRTPALESPVC